MYADLNLFRLAGAMASHSGHRQALTAQNMANVDTPGYRAQRLPTFSAAVDETGPRTGMKVTRAGHFTNQTANGLVVAQTELRDQAAPDGNTVTVEREMLESVSSKREHDRALAIYKSALNILHANLSGR